MITRFFSLIILLVLTISCGQQSKKTTDLSELEISEVTVEALLADASSYVETPISIKGTVVHVCRHGGQRLFIVGEDGEDRFRITVGENISEFDVELEGSKIEVNGIVKELIIDDTYLAEWEAEVGEGSKHDRGEGHEGGVGHGDNHGEAPDQTEDHDEGHDADSDNDHAEGHEDHGEEADGEHDVAEQEDAQLERIQAVRDEIAASGQDHLSDYWIETIEFKVITE